MGETTPNEMAAEFMINPYCAPLQRIFAELSYYGLLKEEDAQCLRTDVKVESTFYVLFIGTVSLAVLNTFVMKAVAQFFRDRETTFIFAAGQGAVVSDLGDLTEFEMSNGEAASHKIRPVPVLFTDRFRWLLHREGTRPTITSNPVGDSAGGNREYPVEPIRESAPSFHQSNDDLESLDIESVVDIESVDI